MPMRRRLMALDIGHKRIGVAISDPLQMTARPLQTLQRRGARIDAESITQLAEEWEAEELIVGQPRHLDGRNASILTTIQALVRQIEGRSSLPVRWVDERLSSKEAEELMAESGIRVADRRRRRDEFAAAVILRRYLEEVRDEPK